MGRYVKWIVKINSPLWCLGNRPLRDDRSGEEKPTGTVASRSRTSKWRESQEERRRQQVQTKLQVLLFRHKELLKKDMIKKRALLEKELQIEIQVRRIKHQITCFLHHSSVEDTHLQRNLNPLSPRRMCREICKHAKITVVWKVRRWTDKFCLHCNIFIYIRHVWIKWVLCCRMVSLFHHTSPWTHRCLSPHTVHIEMEEFSDGQFKQHAAIEFLTVEKVPSIEIHRRMQAVYGDQCVDVSTVRRWVRWSL